MVDCSSYGELWTDLNIHGWDWHKASGESLLEGGLYALSTKVLGLV